ncbi:MAG: ATP-binding protein [Solobacterium sp.]|nr:ATP-binding protein [Solobacterium sp.]
MEIKREKYLQEIIDRMHNGMIKVITGLRRSGKSYLMNHIFYNYLLSIGIDDSHIIMVQLDVEENEALLDRHALAEYLKNKIIDRQQYYFLLDEIQEVDGFEKVLNSFLRRENVDLYVTGSNSKFLSTDIRTELRGRGDEIHIYPLSFKEFYDARQGKEPEVWNEYMIYGGMPLILSRRTDEQKSKYLKDLFEETYIKDIAERNRIKGIPELEELVDIMASSIGSLANPTRISNTFASLKHITISSETVKNYLAYLENAFLISEIKRYDVKGKKYINTPLKYYFEDIGLRNARLNFRQLEESHLMENIIYNELRYRGFNIDVGMVEINEKKDNRYIRKQLEVDFIAYKGNRKYYIQVAQEFHNEEKKEQELKSLKEIPDGFKKIVIRKDNSITYTDDDGILHLYLFDFLLDRNSLE